METPTPQPNIFEIINNLRSVRHFREDPVEDEKLRLILEAAVKAPNTGNDQAWDFILVRDPAVKEKIRDIAVDALKFLWKISEFRPDKRDFYQLSASLVENTHKVPLLVIVCFDPSRLSAKPHGIYRLGYALPVGIRIWQQTMDASIFPAIQNLLLAAKALGIAGILTTSIVFREKKLKKLLGIPRHVRALSMVYLGYPARKFRPPSRLPAEKFLHFEKW